MTDAQLLLAEMHNVGRDYVVGGVATVALRHATCAVHAGDRIAIVGRSGSGKSTLLHLLAGLDQPSSGSVAWPALGAPDQLRPGRIGMVFQFPSLVPWLSVAENVALPLQLMGRHELATDAARLALQRFELAALATKLPEELSGGQAQRVALVRATITDPALVLADEPTGQLDHTTGAQLIDMLLAWADEHHAAIVIATHDLAVARRLFGNWQMEHGTLRPQRERLVA
jgi:ABC-type lipoprotein export system ATPase subunit